MNFFFMPRLDDKIIFYCSNLNKNYHFYDPFWFLRSQPNLNGILDLIEKGEIEKL